MDFSETLARLKAGAMAYREGWNGKNQWIEVQSPGRTSKMTEPYIFMRIGGGKCIPWVVSQADIFANDWKTMREGD